MLTSSQVQFIENALKKGKRVRRCQETVFQIEYPSNASPDLVMTSGLVVSADHIKAGDIFIGDFLSSLCPM